MTQEFELPYWVKNSGDGSVSVKICASLTEAEKADEEQDEGWGESSASTISLKIENGKLYFETYDWDAPRDKRVVWKEVPVKKK